MYIEKKWERERVGCEFVRSMRECWEVRLCFYVCIVFNLWLCTGWVITDFKECLLVHLLTRFSWPFLLKNLLWQVWIADFKSRGLWFYDDKVMVFEMPKKLGGTCTFCRQFLPIRTLFLNQNLGFFQICCRFLISKQ